MTHLRRHLLGLAALAIAAFAPLGAAFAQTPCPGSPAGVPLFTNGAATSCEPGRNVFDTGALVTLANVSSAAATADQVNYNGRGLKCVINITAITAGSLTVTIQGKDVASGAYFTLLASAALAATGTTVMTVYPGAPATANVSANDIVGRTWRLNPVIATGPVTATVGCSQLL